MRMTSVEAPWDIIRGLTDISPTLPRPPNTVIRKDRHSKTSIYAHSKPYQKYHKNAGDKISSHGQKKFQK